MNRITKLLRLLQLSDSAFPIGSFSFSNGLEAAVHTNIVNDRASLQQYVESIIFQGINNDVIALLMAYNAAHSSDYEMLTLIDEYIFSTKLNEEMRTMSMRMGKKTAEIAIKLFDNQLLSKWLYDIRTDIVNGLYPVTFAIIAQVAGLDEKQVFSSYYYGVANMVLSASLRCMRVSHYDTQLILRNVISQAEEHYKGLNINELNNIFGFSPEIDVLASIHQKGQMRMFMN